MFDIIFLSFNEVNADKNWKHLRTVMPFPFVRRVNGVVGILNAHQEAARQANTRYFYVVDGDSYVLPKFKFEFMPPKDSDTTYIWKTLNPINDLNYGYGGIKLFNRNKVINKRTMELDMTLSIGDDFSIQPTASITNFDTSPFETWKSAFRECVKLSQKTDDESKERLNIWKTVANGEYASYCLRGAIEGCKYGTQGKRLELINDFKWLAERFE